MKCFIGFQVTLKCLTLNNLRYHFTLKYVLIGGLTSVFCPAFDDNYVKMNESIYTISKKMFARDSSFWQCKVYSGMCTGFCALTVDTILVESHASVAMYRFAKNPTNNL